MLEKTLEDSLPWEGPHVGAGKERVGEGAAKTMCDEVTSTLISHPPAVLRGRR